MLPSTTLTPHSNAPQLLSLSLTLTLTPSPALCPSAASLDDLPSPPGVQAQVRSGVLQPTFVSVRLHFEQVAVFNRRGRGGRGSHARQPQRCELEGAEVRGWGVKTRGSPETQPSIPAVQTSPLRFERSAAGSQDRSQRAAQFGGPRRASARLSTGARQAARSPCPLRVAATLPAPDAKPEPHSKPSSHQSAAGEVIAEAPRLPTGKEPGSQPPRPSLARSQPPSGPSPALMLMRGVLGGNENRALAEPLEQDQAPAASARARPGSQTHSARFAACEPCASHDAP